MQEHQRNSACQDKHVIDVHNNKGVLFMQWQPIRQFCLLYSVDCKLLNSNIMWVQLFNINRRYGLPRPQKI